MVRCERRIIVKLYFLRKLQKLDVGELFKHFLGKLQKTASCLLVVGYVYVQLMNLIYTGWARDVSRKVNVYFSVTSEPTKLFLHSFESYIHAICSLKFSDF